jgi:hypothetical protein
MSKAVGLRLATLTLALSFASGASAGDSCSGKQLPNLVDRSLLIVGGKITKVAPPPGFWSEVLPALQDVQYDVVKIYKGNLGGGQFRDSGSAPRPPQITVTYKVVKDSRLVEKKPPGLSRKFFAEGKELILFLQGPAQDINDECAAQVGTPELENQIKSLLKTN